MPQNQLGVHATGAVGAPRGHMDHPLRARPLPPCGSCRARRCPALGRRPGPVHPWSPHADGRELSFGPLAVLRLLFGAPMHRQFRIQPLDLPLGRRELCLLLGAQSGVEYAIDPLLAAPPIEGFVSAHVAGIAGTPCLRVQRHGVTASRIGHTRLLRVCQRLRCPWLRSAVSCRVRSLSTLNTLKT